MIAYVKRDGDRIPVVITSQAHLEGLRITHGADNVEDDGGPIPVPEAVEDPNAWPADDPVDPADGPVDAPFEDPDGPTPSA